VGEKEVKEKLYAGHDFCLLDERARLLREIGQVIPYKLTIR